MAALDIYTIANVFFGVLMATTAYTIGYSVLQKAWEKFRMKSNPEDTADKV